MRQGWGEAQPVEKKRDRQKHQRGMWKLQLRGGQRMGIPGGMRTVHTRDSGDTREMRNVISTHTEKVKVHRKEI